MLQMNEMSRSAQKFSKPSPLWSKKLFLQLDPNPNFVEIWGIQKDDFSFHIYTFHSICSKTFLHLYPHPHLIRFTEVSIDDLSVQTRVFFLHLIKYFLQFDPSPVYADLDISFNFQQNSVL